MLIDLIKSVVIPSKMGRHKNMSILFAVMIFILASYVITGSTIIILNSKGVNNPDLYYRNIDQLLALEESDDTLAFPTTCTIEEGRLSCGQPVYYNQLEYTFTSKTVTDDDTTNYVFIVYDLNNVGLSSTIGKYPEFQDSTENPFKFHVTVEKGQTFETMTGFKTGTTEGVVAIDPEDGDITNALTIQGAVDTDTVGAYFIYYVSTDSDGNKTRLRRVVSVVEDEEDLFNIYLITFVNTSMLYETLDAIDSSRIISESISYKESSFDVTQVGTNVVDNLRYFSYRVVEFRILFSKGSLGIISLFLVMILPLPVVLISFMLFKRTGAMKKFKNYYNIGAITIILPSIIAFILGFFVRFEMFFAYFYIVYQMFYIFVVFQINKSESGDASEPVNIYSKPSKKSLPKVVDAEFEEKK